MLLNFHLRLSASILRCPLGPSPVAALKHATGPLALRQLMPVFANRRIHPSLGAPGWDAKRRLSARRTPLLRRSPRVPSTPRRQGRGIASTSPPPKRCSAMPPPTSAPTARLSLELRTVQNNRLVRRTMEGHDDPLPELVSVAEMTKRTQRHKAETGMGASTRRSRADCKTKLLRTEAPLQRYRWSWIRFQESYGNRVAFPREKSRWFARKYA